MRFAPTTLLLLTASTSIACGGNGSGAPTSSAGTTSSASSGTGGASSTTGSGAGGTGGAASASPGCGKAPPHAAGGVQVAIDAGPAGDGMRGFYLSRLPSYDAALPHNSPTS